MAKTNREHFYNNLFIIDEEIYVAQKQVYWGVMQGKMRERCSATILQQLIKQTQSRLVTRIIQARFTRFE